MSQTVQIGTVMTIRTRDGKAFTGGVKLLEKQVKIALQLYQPGPPAIKEIAWQDIQSSAIVEPGKIQLSILKDQVLECYRQIFQCNYTTETARSTLGVASPDVRKELETRIIHATNEMKLQKRIHKGLEPHIAVLNEKERHEINLAVQQQQQINAKKVQDIKRLQQQQAQKLAQQRKGVNSLKTPIQTKGSVAVRQKSGDAYSPQAVSSPSASAAAAGAKKPPMSKAERVGQLIRAMPADKQAGTKVMTKRKLQHLVSQIAPHEKMDEAVEDLLLDIADDFIESVTDFACLLAKHRNSKVLEVKDVQLHLERNWNMRLPGFGQDHAVPSKKTVAEVHKQRLSQVKKAQLAEKK